MADYIYTMEIRLTPDQLKGVSLVQDVARAAGMNLYLTGGAIRDIISGFTIRDLDFTVQGNPLKLQKDSRRRAPSFAAVEEESGRFSCRSPAMPAPKSAWRAPSASEKTGKPPIVSRRPLSMRIFAAATSPSTPWPCR